MGAMGVKSPTEAELLRRMDRIMRRLELLLDAAERHPLIRAFLKTRKD